MQGVRIAAVAALTVALAGFVAASEPDSAHGVAAQLRAEGITVSGTGVVRAVPDRARLSFGVLAQARTASQALAANDAEMRRVIAALRNAGVAAADIQTQSFAVMPRHTERGDEIVGYAASNSVSAMIRDLDRVGAVIDAAVDAGANQVYGPSLSRSDTSELYRNALRAGIADARGKAQAIASAAGVSVGQIVGVQELGASPNPVAESARAGDAPPIEPGTQEIQATVVVSFGVA